MVSDKQMIEVSTQSGREGAIDAVSIGALFVQLSTKLSFKTPEINAKNPPDCTFPN